MNRALIRNPVPQTVVPITATLLILSGCASVDSPSGNAGAFPATPTVSNSLAPMDQMLVAIDSGDVVAVATLLDAGYGLEASLNPGLDGGPTALHRAASMAQVDIVSIFLDAGASVDARTSGMTPLMLAMSTADGATVQALLEGGADPTLTNPRLHGCTPLHYAARDNNADTANALLDWGVDPDAPDNDGSTPLHWAAGEGNTEVALLLIERGADPTLRNVVEKTPSDDAYDMGFPELGDALSELAGNA
jgi:hypothetical protein